MRRWTSLARAGLSLAVAAALSCTQSDPATPTPPPPPCARHDPSRADPTPNPVTVVRVDPSAPAPLQIAVQACAGLSNRAVGGSVYVQSNEREAAWITELAITPTATVDAADFLASCLQRFTACVRYDYASQRTLMPNVLTVGAALGAVPVDASLGVTCGSTAFDAVEAFRERSTPALATRYVFDTFSERTTGLAMLNPGYDRDAMDQSAPPIRGDMRPELIDFVFSRRLFVSFLVNGCTPGNPERELFSAMVNAGRWPLPLAVYGYNSSWLVAGGYLYEAQTRCLDSRNMGAVASETTNLSFFSTRSPAITESNVVTQNAREAITYDPSRTYVAFVVGDGDNIAYMLSTRREWFRQRLAACASGAPCPSLSWTISPHLAQVAPDVLRWYYDRSHETGHDYFALPPSGHLYAYPSSLSPTAQDRFVAATEADACVLDLSGTVHWDWFGTWRDAESVFLPKYARAGGTIRGVFPVNVPYLLPTFTWWAPDQFSEVLTGADGSRVALFRPRQWRGVNNDADVHFLSPARMAEEIGAYPRGTVTWVYLTSDGGLTLENSFLAVAAMLPAHVQLVSTDAAARLAVAAAGD